MENGKPTPAARKKTKKKRCGGGRCCGGCVGWSYGFVSALRCRFLSLSLSILFFFSLFFWLLLLLSLRASVCVCVCWIVGSTTFDPRPRRTWAEKTPSVSFPRSPVVALVVPTPVAAGYGSPTAVKEQRKRQKKTNKNNEPAVSFVVRFSVPDCNHPPKKNMRSSHIYIYF